MQQIGSLGRGASGHGQLGGASAGQLLSSSGSGALQLGLNNGLMGMMGVQRSLGPVLPLSHFHSKQLEQLEIARQASTPHHHARLAATQARTTALTEQKNGKSDAVSERQRAKGQWTALDLGGMAIKNLSPSLFKYEFLTQLYLNHNSLSRLPAEIGQLRQLVTLDLTGNKLTSIPVEVGLLVHLRELLLYDNQLNLIPFELGFLYCLEELGLEGNPLNEGLLGLLQKEGLTSLIHYLRENCPVSAQPQEREWIVLDSDSGSVDANHVFTVLNYNVLCEKYASPQSYAYVPSWVLNWEYRRELILQEVLNYNADVVCLQEVEVAQFEEYFKEQLAMVEYSGVFFPKSRARTMDEMSRRSVDGCAIFFKSAKFNLLEKHVIEFQQMAMQRPEFRKQEDIFSRVMIKDNIAVLALLETVETGQRLLVANVHLHWDPNYRDVKILQTAMLMDEIQRLLPQYVQSNPSKSGSTAVAAKHFSSLSSNAENAAFVKNLPRIPIIVSGDFNSTPDSGVYELMSTGYVAPENEDMTPPVLDIDVSKGDEADDGARFVEGKRPVANENVSLSSVYPNGVRHALPLKSAYDSVDKLEFTNWTPTFKGLIDHIFYDTRLISIVGLLGAVDPKYCKRHVGFPNWHHPSDHVPLLIQIKIADEIQQSSNQRPSPLQF